MTLQEQNQKRWNNCHVYSARGPLFEKVAERIKANKTIYQDVEKRTGVPWWFVGITHYRESNLNLNTQLGQGDPLHSVSVHVPRGRGPFKTFEDGAYDALVNCAPKAANNKDWSIGGALTMFEKYNGLGYANKGLPSPYVWAGTDQYTSGKYVADGVFDPNAVDSQLGCAGLMKYLGVGKSDKPAISIGTGGAVATAAAASYGWVPAIIIGAVVLGVVAYLIYRNRKKINVTENHPVLPEHVEEGSRLGKTDVE